MGATSGLTGQTKRLKAIRAKDTVFDYNGVVVIHELYGSAGAIRRITDILQLKAVENNV